jgi:hypothetical protein
MSSFALNRDTLIAAAINGAAALLAVRFLIPSEAAVGIISQHSIVIAITMGVVSILSDMVYPRVSTFLADYNL